MGIKLDKEITDAELVGAIDNIINRHIAEKAQANIVPTSVKTTSKGKPTAEAKVSSGSLGVTSINHFVSTLFNHFFSFPTVLS